MLHKKQQSFYNCTICTSLSGNSSKEGTDPVVVAITQLFIPCWTTIYTTIQWADRNYSSAEVDFCNPAFSSLGCEHQFLKIREIEITALAGLCLTAVMPKSRNASCDITKQAAFFCSGAQMSHKGIDLALKDMFSAHLRALGEGYFRGPPDPSAA